MLESAPVRGIVKGMASVSHKPISTRPFSMLRSYALPDLFTIGNAAAGTGAIFLCLSYLQGGSRAFELTSPATYFHGGASGTLVWADPTTELVEVLFTNRAFRGWPTDRPRVALFANAVSAALR